MSSNYLKRYQAGEYSVWDELVSLGPTVLDNPDLFSEASAVAHAIMERVRSNVSLLRKTLIAAGARIGDEGVPHAAEDLAPLRERFGPLPLSLDVFYQTIGSINLTPAKDSDYDYGTVTLEKLDGISLIALDPLQVEPASEFGWLIEEYDERVDECEFELYISPDFLHKQDISGGMPYSVQLPPVTPRDRLDPTVLWERHELSFVNYLRYCFKWGGFPGLDVIEQAEEEIDLNWRIAFQNVQRPWRPPGERLLQALRRDLDAF